jgi:2-oxoglutarate dehydrogenase E2 component (dihydrolipoamide succinyltransferase)
VRHTVKLPRLADTVDEVVVLSWSCEVGDTVAEGAPLMSVETDKVDTEVPSPIAGVLVEQLVAADDEIPTGTDIAVIEK